MRDELGAPADGCILESSFHELYPLLGDQAAQDAVRANQPGRHCPKLRHDPNACLGCPNNPYEKQGRLEKLAQGATTTELVESAFRLHDLAELGLMDTVHPVEELVLRLTHQYRLAERMNRQAEFIAGRVAEMFTKKK